MIDHQQYSLVSIKLPTGIHV